MTIATAVRGMWQVVGVLALVAGVLCLPAWRREAEAEERGEE